MHHVFVVWNPHFILVHLAPTDRTKRKIKQLEVETYKNYNLTNAIKSIALHIDKKSNSIDGKRQK